MGMNYGHRAARERVCWLCISPAPSRQPLTVLLLLCKAYLERKRGGAGRAVRNRLPVEADERHDAKCAVCEEHFLGIHHLLNSKQPHLRIQAN